MSDSLLQYPMRTISLSMLHLMSKFGNVAWVLLAQIPAGPGTSTGTLMVSAIMSQVVLTVATVTIYSKLPNSIKVAEAEGRDYDVIRLQKLMWLTVFIYSLGVADRAYDILVHLVGEDLCGSTQLGLGLMYIADLILFVVLCAIVAGFTDRCSQCRLSLLPGESTGAEWADAPGTGAPKL